MTRVKCPKCDKQIIRNHAYRIVQTNPDAEEGLAQFHAEHINCEDPTKWAVRHKPMPTLVWENMKPDKKEHEQ